LNDVILNRIIGSFLQRRNQPAVVGKIVVVMDLLEVRNVPITEVRDKLENLMKRKAPKGYEVVGSRTG
ncbi:hypothetical protein B0H13DRAFT_1473058, partial [Mycena leptocephala]